MTAHQALENLSSQLFDLSANLTAQTEALPPTDAASLAVSYANIYRDFTP